MRRLLRIGLIAIIVLCVAVTAVNLMIARLPAMPPADGEYISLRGKEIHYTEQLGSGTPVVLIHGLPGTHEDFDPVLPELSGLHVLAIDRPGYGWSKGGWLPYQEQIDVVHEFLTRRGLAPAVLVGHSFGGSLALGVARRYPRDVAKMVLVAPGSGGMTATPADLFNARYAQAIQLPVIGPVSDFTVNNVIQRLAGTGGAHRAFDPDPVDPTYQQRLLAVTMTRGNLDSFASDELELNRTGRWLAENQPQITVPSVVIGAVDDNLVAIDRVRHLASVLPNTELITVDGGHMIPYSHPDAVAEQVRAALAATVRP